MNKWPIVSLGELLALERRPVKVAPDSYYQEIGIYCFGRGIFHKPPRSGLEVDKKDLFLIKSGDFILQITFAWEGAVAVASAAEDGMYGSVRFPTFRVNEGKCDPQYLLNYFRTHEGREQLVRICPGSAGRNRVLSIKRLPEVIVPLPPLSEQRRIVAKIEDLNVKIDESISLKGSVHNELDLLFDAQLGSVFQRLAKSSASVSLLDIVDPDRGISYGVVLTGLDFEDGIPTLRAGDLYRFKVLLKDVKRIDPNIEAKYKRTRLRGNEVLLRIRGGFGEVAVCPNEMIGGNVSREIAVIPIVDHLDPYYLMYALAAPSSQDFMKSKVRGTSYVGINLKDVRRLPIPIPSIEEQKRIVAYFDELKAQVDVVNQLHAATATELEALMSSFLDRAFKGEL
jgi:type I restriction enzyme S subunit